MKDGSTTAKEPAKCSIFEILQYTCPPSSKSLDGKPLIRCYPLPRIFKMCPGHPAVEMTTFVDISKDGEVTIPHDFK
ncbi:hypothetical protein CPC08DRAFT_628352 [Agrocybe pediades]|nr:hypothetical protein CPC08DRAFT_628352 [Agrocybe pediades]